MTEHQLFLGLFCVMAGSLIGLAVGQFILTPLLFKLWDMYDKYKENQQWWK